jgi:hypothetical protein
MPAPWICVRPKRARRYRPAVDGLEERNLTSAAGLGLDAAVLPQRHAIVSGIPGQANQNHHGSNAAEPLAVRAANRGRNGRGHRPVHRGANGGHPGTLNPGGPNPGNPNPGNLTPGTPNPGHGGVQAQLLPGKWRAEYDASNIGGFSLPPGSRGVQEYVFVTPGPDGVGTFHSITGGIVPGTFAPSYYQVSTYGTWQQIDQTEIRLTIDPEVIREYALEGFKIPSGQTVTVNFINPDQFASDLGITYNRVPLDSSVFGP